VDIKYVIAWHDLVPGTDTFWSVSRLRLSPSGNTLAEAPLDFKKWADNTQGKLSGTYVRDSGFFDSQEFPGESYQLVLFYRNSYGLPGGIAALSEPVKIPSCQPMSPTTGPASGGTVVTALGGGSLGAPLFTLSTIVSLQALDGSGTEMVTPTQVAKDGTWLTFLMPPGTANACVLAYTALPFPLGQFCYEP
jgi:hypothetical protein